jgi:hypothetical protein
MTPLPGLIRTLEGYVEGCGARVLRAPLPDSVHGRMLRDLIIVRPGLTPLQEFAVLVHEIAHWLVHADPHDCHECTLFEYEAEAVEALVMKRLGLARGRGVPTDGLLPASVARVHIAGRRICQALGVTDYDAGPTSEPQAAVDFEAATGEEIVVEYEAYGMGDFFGLPEAL